MFSFIETRLFTKLVLDYMTDDEYSALQISLMTDPEAGPVIPARAVSASFAGRRLVAANGAITA